VHRYEVYGLAEKTGPSTTIAVRHRVSDYAAWRQVYDDHGAVRLAHGCTGDLVLQDQDDPHEVLVLTYWPSAQAAQGFIDDPSLKDAMSRGGVVSDPRIEVYSAPGS
jgi:heme-degrading monooxygenase HmoA